MTNELESNRVLVVGGSSGIGRSVAITASQRGARVAVVGRRSAETHAVAEETSGTAIVADIREPEDCQRIATEAVAALGNIDLFVCAAAVAPIQLIDRTEPEVWRAAFETNVIGPMLTARYVLPHMSYAGLMGFVSSETVGFPYHGMGAYSSSKAALEEAVRALRAEHPEVRITCIPVGATIGTDITRGTDPETIAELFPIWLRTGRLEAGSMQPEHVGDVIFTTMAAYLQLPDVNVETLVVRPMRDSPPTDLKEVVAQVEAQKGEA